MRSRAFVSGAVIWQYASHHKQSPAVSSLGQTEGESVKGLSLYRVSQSNQAGIPIKADYR